jgi:hypothetical protein
MDEIKHPPTPGPHSPGPHPPGPGHETQDVNVWAVGKFAIGLVAVCIISLSLLLGLMKFFQSREETSRATTIEPTKLFPEPQLQKTPIQDLKSLRVEEDKLLNGYAWLDPQKGLVRMPIDQAIDVLAKRGLPVRTAVPVANGSTVPTESSLGPLAPGGVQPGEAAPLPGAEQKSIVGPKDGKPEQVNTKEVQRK